MNELDDLPLGWASVAIREVIESKVDQQGPVGKGEFTYVDISSVDNSTKVIADAKKLPLKDAPSRARQQIKTGDVLVSMTRPNLNAVAIVPQRFDGAIASTGFDVLRARGAEPDWLFAHVRSKAFIDAMSELVRGALYPAVNAKEIRDYTIPLPPLLEQRRIVAKIEALQARSRKAREALEAIPPLLEQFRQSVLAAAFRGDLTAGWREQHPDVEPASVLLERIQVEPTISRKRGRISRAAVAESEAVDHDEGTLPETWQAVRLRDVLTLQPGYAFSSKDFTREGIRLLRGTNIVPNGTRWDETVCLPSNKAQLFGDYKLQTGDIVFAMDRPIISTGIKVARIADSDLPALLLQRVGRFRLSSCIEPRFLYSYLQSSLFRQHIDTRETGTQVPHVSGNDIESAPFVLPSLSEQVEISRILDSATQRVEGIYQAVQQGISDLEALDQSILAKAFRGDLVPQDPNAEPASVLLERIQAKRADVADGKPARGRRKQVK